MNFATPVRPADTTYVAGYLAPNGHYSINGPTLEAAVDNAPLHARSRAAGGNGVYAYGAGAGFPTLLPGPNYWVDVLFTPGRRRSRPGRRRGSAPAPASARRPSPGPRRRAAALRPATWSPPTSPARPRPRNVTGTPPATSTTVSGLTAGSSYTFTVKASNGAGSGPESAPSNRSCLVAPRFRGRRAPSARRR